MKSGHLLLAGAALIPAACTTPLPALPVPPTASAWSETTRRQADSVDDRWWLAFADPILDELMQRAAVADDVALAQSRLDTALARLRSARAELRPNTIASGSANAQSIDELEQVQFQSAAAIGWTIDLNGAAKARSRAALAQVNASAARVAAARQTTRAMAARLYLTWREALARAAADEEAVASLAANERLVEVRTRAGLAPQLERLSLATERAAAEARPAAARQAAATARLGLEALLGYSPGTLRYLESRVSDIPLPRGADPLDSPAAVLARRPDLIAAEFELAGADARSVAARRDFWPTISIGAMLGLGAIDTSVSGPTGGPIARASAGLLAPLLSFGRLEAARDEQDALRREAALRYRQAVNNALAEVETALAITRETGSRLSSLTVAIASSRDRTRLAEARYRAGLASYLEVLAAVTAEARLESELVTARADRARAHVALSTAMGLGAS